MLHDDHVINPELLKLASNRLRKRAFVPGGDPSMGGGAPPGGDPMAGGGGAPPMDPSMMGGAPPMDPSMMGGAPPPPPSGGGGDPAVGAKLDQLLQLMQGGVGGQSGGNAAGQIKPKIDVNVEIMKLNKMVARIADALQVHIPAHEMVATPQDLTAMANQQAASGQQDAAMAGGGAIGQMPGMDPMAGAGVPGPPKQGSYQGPYRGHQQGRPYRERGEAFDHPQAAGDLSNLRDKAAAVHSLLQSRRRK